MHTNISSVIQNPPSSPSLEEVLAEILAALPPEDSGGLTTREIAQRLGVSEMTALRRVRELVASGRITPVRKRIWSIDGQMRTVTAWAPAKPAEPRESQTQEVPNDHCERS